MEAAGLAAKRATKTQKHAIRKALDAIDAAIDRDKPAIAEDFAFHAVITEATGNPQFRRFLDFLGRFIIPRSSVRIRALNMRGYLPDFQHQHRDIVAAIDAGSAEEAQAATRHHLVNSRQRYRALNPLPEPPAPP